MNNNLQNLILIIVVIFGIGLLIFLIIRSVVLWYFKIDTRVNQNKELIRLLKEINSKMPIKDSFDDFIDKGPKINEEEKLPTQQNYFEVGDNKEEILKGFSYLVSSDNEINIHSLLLLNSDQISFNYEQGQFNEYEGKVSLIMFYINSDSDKYILNGHYSEKYKTLSGEVTLNQNFGSDNSELIKFISCELKLKEWESDYDITFKGILENNEKIEGIFKGKIERLPNLDDW